MEASYILAQTKQYAQKWEGGSQPGKQVGRWPLSWLLQDWNTLIHQYRFLPLPQCYPQLHAKWVTMIAKDIQLARHICGEHLSSIVALLSHQKTLPTTKRKGKAKDEKGSVRCSADSSFRSP